MVSSRTSLNTAAGLGQHQSADMDLPGDTFRFSVVLDIRIRGVSGSTMRDEAHARVELHWETWSVCHSSGIQPLPHPTLMCSFTARM